VETGAAPAGDDDGPRTQRPEEARSS
jgi:hypothetical protein